MVGLIDDKSTGKLQQDITLLGLNEYAQMESTTAFQPDQTPSDPAPNPPNSTNVIVHNTQQPQRFATSEAQTPASSTSDHAAFFNYPSNIFQPQPSAATIYGASPYSASGYSDPSTPANGFPTPNLFSPMSYNAYAIPTPMDFNVIFSPWTINAAAMAAEIGSEILPDQAYQLAAASSSHSTISNRLTPIHGADIVSQQAAFPFNMTRNNYGAGTQMRVNAPRKGGGRRPREIEDRNDLNDEDRDKRDKRRQRNKEAAARCRQRRIDLMTSLQQQLDSFKQQNGEMERIIQVLNQQKMQCIQMLHNHGCLIPKEITDQPILNMSNSYANGMHHQKEHLQLPPLVSPPQNPNKRRANQQSQPSMQQRIPPVSMAQMNDYNDDPLSVSPTPSNGTYNSSASSLITNNDPVISEAAVDIPLKRIKEERDSPIENNRTRPGTLPLNATTTGWTMNLPSITTPSTGILMGFDTNPPEYGGLMSQQTGITPLAPQPQPVISSSSIAPPGESVLRQL